MPKNYTMTSLPRPNSDEIKISKTNSSIKAAISYSGYSNIKIENNKRLELIEVLNKHNIVYENDFDVLIYNSPYKLFNRRNEIIVSVNIKNSMIQISSSNNKVYIVGISSKK